MGLIDKSNRRYSYGQNERQVNYIIKILAQEKKGKLLDVGAFNGRVVSELKKLGFKVEACDIDTSNFLYPDIRIKKADLMRKLPYPNSSFDIVACSEVLEHIENPWHAIRELNRVLKKNGILLVTTPNITNIISRFIFFARGNFRQFYDFHWKDWGHINPMTFGELYRILQSNGFGSIQASTQEMHPVFYGTPLNLIRLLVSFGIHLFKTIFWGKDHKDATLARLLESSSLLYGETLVIKCRKK